ncbi:MAG TPA: elongation factor G [Candidatus Polarisedimenticolaceae bacterium]|nr:elongation factor G [Candidatus Polarisedimenticolaceae bacterium]
MRVYEGTDVRNVALIGHGAAGKTSLTAAMLFAAGAVNRLGKVDDGSAPTDFEEEEIHRKLSMQTAPAYLEWKKKKINLLDTPGYASFVADAKSGVAAADAALLVVDGVAGVQVMTARTFQFAQERSLPLLFVINKLDRERASFERALQSVQERFGRTAVPLQLPVGDEHAFRGVIDLFTLKAQIYERDGSGKARTEEVPADLRAAAEAARAALVEMVAETDDRLMETFFESGDLPAEGFLAGLRQAVRQRKVFPVLCGAALFGIGVQSLLDAAVELLPAPGELGPAVGASPQDGSELRRDVADGQPVSAFVYKTIVDTYAGRLSLLRVCSGVLRPDSAVINVRTGDPERLNNLGLLLGKQLSPIAEVHAGDLAVASKLKETHTSDTLADPAKPIRYPAIGFPAPSISYAVAPRTKGDEEKLSGALARLTEEDPVLKISRDAHTGELLLSGNGQVHVEAAIAKMKRKFGVDAELKQPKVPYLETITRKVGATEGKHKKQTGGRGQFAVCVIEMEPLPRGQGFEFQDKIFGGSIPQNYRPAVEKGIVEAAHRGYRAGCPVVDFRVMLVDGKYHSVDSSEMAFKIAGSLAFKAAMEQARPTLLEPVMHVEISAPEDCMGDIMGDLSSRRGRPQGMEIEDGYQVIKAQVPMSEMLTYASTLKSITSDRGSYVMEFSHYEEAPAQIQEQIVAAAAKAKQAEAEE